jgi:hypothetical protein
MKKLNEMIGVYKKEKTKKKKKERFFSEKDE